MHISSAEIASLSVDPKSDHFHPKSSKRNADLGRHHLEIEPNFASDGSQIDLYLRQLGRNRFTLKGTEFGSFDSNPKGISDHFTARSAREPGFFGTLRANKARFTPHGQPRRNLTAPEISAVFFGSSGTLSVTSRFRLG